MSEGITVRFVRPDGGHFRQFSMPGVPRKGDLVLQGNEDYRVEQVAWDLENGIHGATPTVVLSDVT